MSVQSSKGLATTGDLSTYDVKSITAADSADNQEYVSSKTGGNTYNEPGNLNKSWNISLYAAAGTYECPAGLKAGQLITCTLPTGGTSRQMLISTSDVVTDIASGALISIDMTCVPYQAASYV